MTIIDMTQFAQPYTGTNADMADFLNPVRTTAQLADIGDPINTLDKRIGRLVLNITSGLLVYADGVAAGDTWSATHDGAVDHTPI